MGVIRRLGRLVRLGLAVLAVTLAAVIWQDTQVTAATARGRALAGPVDAAIVLGAGVEGDGRLAYNSRRRVAAGVRLLQAGRARHLIFSGGVGGNHPATSAAALMRQHAIRLGAAPERLLLEPRAVSTFENIRFSFALAAARGFESLALVSDGYHLTRASWLAAYFGRPELPLATAEGFARAWWPVRSAHYVREALAWWYNLAKVAGWEALGALGLPPAARAEWIR